VIFGALMGAICWNLITWWLGIPSSSSHALIGGLAGAAGTQAGGGAVGGGGVGLTAPPHGFFSFFWLFLPPPLFFPGLVGVCPHEPIGRGQYLPLAAIHLRGALLAGAWRQ